MRREHRDHPATDADVDSAHALAQLGHNLETSGRPAQWQTAHAERHDRVEEPAIEADCDLIKTAFVRAFTSASDPTSFLRVAQIPFEAWTADGERLVLLRVEMDSITDVGSMMPHLGGTSFRYDPLPGKLVTHRERLRFVYFDGKEQRHLPLGSVRALRLPPAER